MASSCNDGVRRLIFVTVLTAFVLFIKILGVQPEFEKVKTNCKTFISLADSNEAFQVLFAILPVCMMQESI